MNGISRAYAKIIFKSFRFGINLFYNSEVKQIESKKNYNRMLKMKQFVYLVFNFLTKNLVKNKNEFLVKINFYESQFFIRGLILSDIVMTSEAWEPYVKKKFVVKESDTIIDVGAHIGTYCISKAKEIGNHGRVIALEPNPNNAKILQKNIDLNKLKNTLMLEKAANSKKQFVKLTLSNDPMLSMITNDETEKTVEIESITLDSLVTDFKLKTVNWLKIDAEGSEILVLQGAKEILEKFHPRIIIEVRKENEGKMKEILQLNKYKLEYLGGEYFFAE